MSDPTSEATTRQKPLAGLAQALGRHRKAWAVGAMALIVATPWAWWMTQLWGLPDVGDPFDVAAFEAERDIPDDRNAFVLYQQAASLIIQTSRSLQVQKKPAVRKFEGEWSKASPEWRDLLALSGEALALWRQGAERPDARYNHPEGISIRTLLPVTMELATLGNLAILEGSRLESEGAMGEAWGWYRSALRASRHSGKHGFLIERLNGAGRHRDVARALTRWASDPRVDAPLLRRALDEVIAIDGMTIPHSDSLRSEYGLFLHSMGDPNLIDDFLVMKNFDEPDDWCQDLPVSDATKRPIQAARVFLADDRERSLRLARLMTANWLAQVDKPRSRRAKVAKKDPTIYEADPAAPPAARALPPEKLAKWLDSSLLAKRYYRGLSKYDFAIDRERARQAGLVVHMADQLHRREHGGEAPPSPRALVGPYLKALPEELGSDPGPP